MRRLPPATVNTTVTVEFNDPDHADQVHELMDDGMRFQHAVEYLELRPFFHYTVTREDAGPDGRG